MLAVTFNQHLHLVIYKRHIFPTQKQDRDEKQKLVIKIN